MFFDPLWLIISLPALLLSFYAQHRVRSAYQQYAQVANFRGLTGAQAARWLLDSAGLRNVPIEETPGELSDHYDPGSRTLRLSPGVGRVPSVAAVGIAAHEVGHALQDQAGYAPMQLRGAIATPVMFASNLAPILFIAGVFVQFSGLVWLGVALFSLAVIFALVTLPVEFDASGRALQLLQANGMVSSVESDAVRTVLNAAALTYLAGLLAAVSQLLYYVLVATGMSRRED
ncbi:MAG: zinc metallopeptidase [Chloroflexi bacterium]|nr:zinc metallopeptidase [Chloroflexota bacterium]